MIIVFDLDDTLYDEKTYVSSGFRTVAGYLHAAFGIPVQESYVFMMNEEAAKGRGAVFDCLLKNYGVFSKKNVQKCVSVYRAHDPDIRLFSEAEYWFSEYGAQYSVYIVTDGNKLVQERKLRALGILNKIKFCYITHRYGRKNAKPSPYCFQRICQRECVEPAEVLYIGDNPFKDFVGIKPLGFKTVRVLTGAYKNISLAGEYESDYRINDLMELTPSFIGELEMRK